MFFFRKTKLPTIQGQTARERLIRGLLLILVVGVTAWGFWKNSERNIERLNNSGAVSDQMGRLSPDDKAMLRGMAAEFKERFGLQVLIHIAQRQLAAPPQDDKTIFIGLAPESRQILLTVPPLVRRALPPDVLTDITQGPLAQAMRTGKCGDGLALALQELWRALSALSGPES